MRKMHCFVAALVLAVANLAGAAAPKEGENFVTYNPPRATESAGKVEVTEFFWYGCDHCFNLESEIQRWLKTMPKDVVFRRVPAVFPGRDGNPGQWASGAALYYTLEAMGLGEKFHDAMFTAIHRERVDLFSEKGMVDWLGKRGVDTKTFSATFQSFAVRSKVQRAMQVTQSHNLDGVPALVVDGRYRAINGPDVMAVVNVLIDKARKDKAKK